MILHRKLLMLVVLAFGIPYCVQAQDGRLEINATISTGGTYMLADGGGFDESSKRNKMSDGILSNLQKESYNSKVYPSTSVEIAYRLSGSGLTGRLSLVGMAGLHIADYEHRNIVDSYSDKHTAVKADVLMGVRFCILETSYLTMYSQALAGTDFRNGSGYWTVTGNTHDEGRNQFVYQITYLGFRVKLGRRSSHFGIMTELGYGSEYALSKIFIMPGMRAGISYRF